MFDFPIYTSVTKKSQMDQLAMFVGSFTKIHKHGRVVCVTPLAESERIQMPRLTYESTPPEVFMYVSVENFFLGKLYTLYTHITNNTWCGGQFNTDLPDFVICKSMSEPKIIDPTLFTVNFNINLVNKPYVDVPAHLQIRHALTVNTKDFKPWSTAVSKFYSEVFVWEQYYDVLLSVKDQVSPDFYANVHTNHQRFVTKENI